MRSEDIERAARAVINTLGRVQERATGSEVIVADDTAVRHLAQALAQPAGGDVAGAREAVVKAARVFLFDANRGETSEAKIELIAAIRRLDQAEADRGGQAQEGDND